MAKTLPSYEHSSAEEDYIDMDISSATFSPPHSGEFEFHMCANPQEKESTTSPADELFYKGNLLPLHLPPRLQMVQRLLHNNTTTNPAKGADVLEDKSCSASGEMNPGEDLYYECSAGLSHSNPKKPSLSMKLIKQSPLSLKLKASRNYLKSLFSKSSCSHESCKEYANGYMKAGKRSPFGQNQHETYLMEDTNNASTLKSSIDREKLMEEDLGHRKSFSGIIKWSLTTKSISSSANSNGGQQTQVLKRSNSDNSDMESSIQGAIAYCKKSQQLDSARKSASDVGFYSLSVPMIAAACETQER
ncbi:probable membrane-associated kinase regulator 4 [Typha angustifolia]|uniref:probable membrane-associated kinase regulator 4 n=1 Tax=Typha angustifolia TaxID=59011 RepID=UPI003C2CCD66